MMGIILLLLLILIILFHFGLLLLLLFQLGQPRVIVSVQEWTRRAFLAPPPQPKDTGMSFEVMRKGAIAAITSRVQQVTTDRRCRHGTVHEVLCHSHIGLCHGGRLKDGILAHVRIHMNEHIKGHLQHGGGIG